MNNRSHQNYKHFSYLGEPSGSDDLLLCLKSLEDGDQMILRVLEFIHYLLQNYRALGKLFEEIGQITEPVVVDAE